VFVGDEDDNDGRNIHNEDIDKESEAQDGEYLTVIILSRFLITATFLDYLDYMLIELNGNITYT